MKTRNILIICKNRNLTVDIQRNTLRGMLIWGSHIKQRYLKKHVSNNGSVREIKAKIETNIMIPEWIGHHRFGIYDLLNYVMNEYRYVYDPNIDPNFFNPISIPSITSIHIYEYLIKKKYKPFNIDNFKGNRSELINLLLKQNPLAVVISVTFFTNVDQIKTIISFIRKINRHVAIIIGSSILLTKLDSNGRPPREYEGIISENVYMILEEYGLDTLHVLLSTIISGGELGGIPNIVYFDGETIKYTKRKEIHYNINANYPEWSNVASVCNKVAFIRGSQGCPYKCKFCTFPKASPKFRERSIESIRDELRKIRSAGITNIAFTDDHFATSQSRVKDICEMMLKEKFDFNWFAGIRASSINSENARILEEAGCKVLCVGLESGDNRILQLMNKKTSTSSNMKCLEILERHNIITYGSFILGFPGETGETFNNTIDWINSSPLKLYKVFLFYLLPGSIIYDEQQEHNISFFGDKYDYCLWKTPTMDALRASELLKQFILRIEKAALIYNYSPMYAFFPFLSKGYSMSEGLEFLKIRTELIKSELSNNSYFSKRRFRRLKLREIKKLITESTSQ